MLRKILATAVVAFAALIPAAPAFATGATQGVGVQLMDVTHWTYYYTYNGNTTPIAVSTADTYIGWAYNVADKKVEADPLAPGESRTYHVKVSNPSTSSAAETMNAYASPAQMSATGSFDWLMSGSNTATAMTSLGDFNPVVAPGGSVIIPVTITVPAGTPAGTYYGVLWAGPQGSNSGGGQITLALYAGIRMYITVS